MGNERTSDQAGLLKDSFIQMLIESYHGPDTILGIENSV